MLYQAVRAVSKMRSKPPNMLDTAQFFYNCILPADQRTRELNRARARGSGQIATRAGIGPGPAHSFFNQAKPIVEMHSRSQSQRGDQHSRKGEGLSQHPWANGSKGLFLGGGGFPHSLT
jgi:hypothetical protein